MNPEDVGQILDELGERIGPAGEYAWHLSVRQVVIEGVLFLVAAIALGVAAFAIVRVARRYNARIKARRAQPNYYGSDSETDGVEWLPVIFLLIADLWITYMGVINLLNPEYQAMMRLLERVTPR